ncbi:hypothetical protein EJB05_13294, partial [Eragrostis curvula]
MRLILCQSLHLLYSLLRARKDTFRKLSVVAILLLLLSSTEMNGPVGVALARDCESKSHKFVGPCVRHANCKSVCQTEG